MSNVISVIYYWLVNLILMLSSLQMNVLYAMKRQLHGWGFLSVFHSIHESSKNKQYWQLEGENIDVKFTILLHPLQLAPSVLGNLCLSQRQLNYSVSELLVDFVSIHLLWHVSCYLVLLKMLLFSLFSLLTKTFKVCRQMFCFTSLKTTTQIMFPPSESHWETLNNPQQWRRNSLPTSFSLWRKHLNSSSWAARPNSLETHFSSQQLQKWSLKV